MDKGSKVLKKITILTKRIGREGERHGKNVENIKSH
jgi:hypothetical protein